MATQTRKNVIFAKISLKGILKKKKRKMTEYFYFEGELIIFGITSLVLAIVTPISIWVMDN